MIEVSCIGNIKLSAEVVQSLGIALLKETERVEGFFKDGNSANSSGIEEIIVKIETHTKLLKACVREN